MNEKDKKQFAKNICIEAVEYIKDHFTESGIVPKDNHAISYLREDLETWLDMWVFGRGGKK